MNDSLKQRYLQILETIHHTADRCGRSPDEIRLVGVSKKHPPELIREAWSCGLKIIGENRIQEAEEKHSLLSDLDLEWHFIGGIQTNKLKKALPVFDLYHGVDRMKAITALQKEAERANRNIPFLLQVNIGEEENKHGASVTEVESLLQASRDSNRLFCRGLTAIPPYHADPEDVRPYFAAMRTLAEQHAEAFETRGERIELSMGMSHDYRVAIQEGATLIRIGTGLFGQRPS